MEGKLCLVTGADSGIGQGLAMLLAEAGHRVIACSRTAELAEEARKAILANTPAARVETLVADFAHPESVRAAAEAFHQHHQHLDVLCNIAGASFWKREETALGIEKNLAINHLGPFLLTHLLLDALKAAPQGRIVNVVGEYHRKVNLEFDDLQWERRKYSAMQAGSTAMLMRVMHTFELARQLKGSRVTANCFHPGAVRTNLLKSAPWVYRVLLGWIQLFFLSPKKGADTGFWLATDLEAHGFNGLYFIKRRPVASSAEANDQEKAGKLRELSMQMCGL